MKSSYELAMERLEKSGPVIKLSDTQKRELAALDARYAAKIAEREIAMDGEITAAAAAGEFEKEAELRQRLVFDRKKLQAELEDKKESVRQAAARK